MAVTVVQQLCKSCRTCFKFYWMFYFTCDRSFTVPTSRRHRTTGSPSDLLCTVPSAAVLDIFYALSRHWLDSQRLKLKKRQKHAYVLMVLPWQSHRTSLAISDHTVLPATRQKWTRLALTPARRWVLDLPTTEGSKAELTQQWNGRESNSRPLDHKSDADNCYTTEPLRQTERDSVEQLLSISNSSDVNRHDVILTSTCPANPAIIKDSLVQQ